MLDEGILSIVPPPWRLLPKGGYINDVTGEMSESHPMEKLLHQRNVPNENVNEVGENHRPGASAVKFPSMALSIPLEETPSVGLMDATERSLHEESDHSCIIKFDDVDAHWRYSVLECKYGIVDRYDLFIGAQVKVFGRHLSITSTNGSTCEWIEKEGQKLRKRIDQLQTKIQSLGEVPCVTRAAPVTIKSVGRPASKPGSVNLRKLNNDILKLQEQLVDLGVAHFTCS